MPRNLWAIEKKEEHFAQGLRQLRDYKVEPPNLLNVDIGAFLESSPQTFDILYLDFVDSVWQSLDILKIIFRYHHNPLSVVITNFRTPNLPPQQQHDEVMLVTCFLAARHGYWTNHDGKEVCAEEEGWNDEEGGDLWNLVSEQFDHYYSECVSMLLYDIASVVVPWNRLLLERERDACLFAKVFESATVNGLLAATQSRPFDWDISLQESAFGSLPRFLGSLSCHNPDKYNLVARAFSFTGKIPSLAAHPIMRVAIALSETATRQQAAERRLAECKPTKSDLILLGFASDISVAFVLALLGIHRLIQWVNSPRHTTRFRRLSVPRGVNINSADVVSHNHKDDADSAALEDCDAGGEEEYEFDASVESDAAEDDSGDSVGERSNVCEERVSTNWQPRPRANKTRNFRQQLRKKLKAKCYKILPGIRSHWRHVLDIVCNCPPSVPRNLWLKSARLFNTVSPSPRTVEGFLLLWKNYSAICDADNDYFATQWEILQRALKSDFSYSINCDVFDRNQVAAQLFVGFLSFPSLPVRAASDRFSYADKVQRMMVDVIVFDQCRYLFNAFISGELFLDSLQNRSQLACLRMVLDGVRYCLCPQVNEWFCWCFVRGGRPPFLPRPRTGLTRNRWIRLAELQQRNLISVASLSARLQVVEARFSGRNSASPARIERIPWISIGILVGSAILGAVLLSGLFISITAPKS